MKQQSNYLTITIVIALTVIIASTAALHLFHNKRPAATNLSSAKQMYHCPMHPSYISDKPGNCPICAMKLVPITKDDSKISDSGSKNQNRTIMYYRDAMKPWITSDKPGKASDGMELVPVYEDQNTSGESGIKIDPTTIQNMGVTTAPVVVKNLKKEIRTSATLDYNEKSVSIVNTKITGYVEQLYVNFTGQLVKKGEPLLSIYSPELLSTQEEYLQAIRYAQGLSGGSQIAKDGAQALVESAKRRLRNWDISETQINELTRKGIPQKTMTIFAPANGAVLEKIVIAGQNIEAGMPLYKIADLSTIWAMANVYQEDLPYIQKGMIASVELTSIPGKIFNGKIQFISPVLDINSKTAQVRIEVPNTSDFLLKPQMFATVNIFSPVSSDGLAIPEQSVIHSGTRNIVIVSLGNGYFKPQEIKTGTTVDGYIQVLSGLQEGQIIVTSSQFLIDSESNLRAAVSKLSGSDTTNKSNDQNREKEDHMDHNMSDMSKVE